MKKACITVGEAVWTLTYTENKDGSVNILNFDSEDNDGYMFRETLGTLDFIKEEEGRVAVAVSIDGNEHVVSNPQHVFTYKQPH